MATSQLATISSELAALVERAAAHVVGVAARPHRPASGLALGGDLVLTADHAVERDTGIVIARDGERHDGTLAGRDPATDLALIRVTGLDAPPVPSAPVPPVGTLVVSIARTTVGTVSAALGVITSVGGPLRTGRGVVLPEVMRTDAALRPGTAGGLIVDMEGRVLGITTPALLRGLPVAIPIAQARAVAEGLATTGSVGRGYLGVSVHGVRVPERQQPGGSGRGLLVAGISPDSAADRAGLLVGDILMHFNDRSLASTDDLQDALAAATPGSTSTLVILRGGATETAAVTVGARAQA